MLGPKPVAKLLLTIVAVFNVRCQHTSAFFKWCSVPTQEPGNWVCFGSVLTKISPKIEQNRLVHSLELWEQLGCVSGSEHHLKSALVSRGRCIAHHVPTIVFVVGVCVGRVRVAAVAAEAQVVVHAAPASHHGLTLRSLSSFDSVSGLVSKTWYRIPFNQSELSTSKFPRTDWPEVRRVAILESIDPRFRGDKRCRERRH